MEENINEITNVKSSFLFRLCLLAKQGRIYVSISRVRMGRGSNAVKIDFQQKFQKVCWSNGWKDRPTDRQSDLLSRMYATKKISKA